MSFVWWKADAGRALLLATALFACDARGPAVAGAPPAQDGPAPSETTAASEAAVALAPADAWKPAPPTELYDVTRVVDGDTLWIDRGGATVKLRLLSVDTEEKLSGQSVDPSKPETVFGQETAYWAMEAFADLAQDGAKPQVGLLFPGGREELDVYGRLLCHVLLPDGTDFNLLLVREGKSPYFDKYGFSELCHEAFVDAQERARAAELGIWNPSTNRATQPGEPEVVRPYDELLPWWRCRALAIEAFRARRAAAPETTVAADDPDALVAALGRDEPVHVFGAVERTFDEDDGALTVLLRSADRDRAFRARIPAALREAFAPLDLPARGESYRQNYVQVHGRLVRGQRGPEIVVAERDDLTLAGPEPSAVELTPAK